MPTYKLRKRSGSPRWYITWTEGRRSRRVPTGTEDSEQAELVLSAYRLEQARPQEQKPSEIAVSFALDAYYDGHAAKLPSASTARVAFKHLKAFYGVAKVSGVTSSSHDEYEMLRKQQGAANETINRERMVLRAALNYMRKRGALREVPHVPTLPKPPARERVLSRAEAALLMRACRGVPHLALFLRLGLYTGARRGAILDLTWDRVDFDRSLIYYPLPGRAQSRKRRAVVPFGGALRTALLRAKKRAKGPYVIEWRRGGIGTVKTGFRLAVARAGLKGVTPHTLRHTAATWAAQAGIPLWEVAGMLGQRLQTTTQVYAKHQPDYLRNASWAMLRGARQLRAKQPGKPS